MKQEAVIIAAGAGIGLLALLAMRGLQTQGAAGLGAAVGRSVIDAGAGVVIGIGEAVGIPATEQTACQRAKAAGDLWEASFACPAGDFISWMARGAPREG